MNILSAVLTEAFGVALVGYVASLALAQGSAKKFKYSVDDNQVECAPRPSLARDFHCSVASQILKMSNA
jgi:hypothetical protein